MKNKIAKIKIRKSNAYSKLALISNIMEVRMKCLLFYVLIGFLGAANYCYSQKIPDELNLVIIRLQNDPNAKYGLENAKKNGFIDQDVTLNQFIPGLPIQCYEFDYKVFDKCDENVALDSLIIKTNLWFIPFKVKGKYSYTVKIRQHSNLFEAVGCSEGSIGYKNDWENVRKKYPESSGIRPILIYDGQYKYLHFPNEKANNLLYLRPDTYNDSLSLVASKSVFSLDDSKTILKYRKKEWEQNRNEREKFLKKHPRIFNNRGGRND